MRLLVDLTTIDTIMSRARRDIVAGNLQSQVCARDGWLKQTAEYVRNLREISSKRLPADTVVALIASEAVSRRTYVNVDSMSLDPSAPTATALALVSNIAGTTSDMELSSFLGRLSLVERADPERFAATFIQPLATTRSSRLAGESVHHFGAFFSRTFRVHDFYVGVADALWSLGSSVFCQAALRSIVGPPSPGSTFQPDSVEKALCIQRFVQSFTTGASVLVLNCAGQSVVRSVIGFPESSVLRDSSCRSNAQRKVLTSLNRALNDTLLPVGRCPFGSFSSKVLCDGNLAATAKSWRDSLGLQTIVDEMNRRRPLPRDWHHICDDRRLLSVFDGDTMACKFAALPELTLNDAGLELLKRLKRAQSLAKEAVGVTDAADAFFRAPDNMHGWGIRSSSPIKGPLGYVIPSSAAAEMSLVPRGTNRLVIAWRFARSIGLRKNLDHVGVAAPLQLLFRPDVGASRNGGTTVRLGAGIGRPWRSGRQGVDLILSKTVVADAAREDWLLSGAWNPWAGTVRIALAGAVGGSAISPRVSVGVEPASLFLIARAFFK
jgi:hypothetical protein